MRRRSCSECSCFRRSRSSATWRSGYGAYSCRAAKAASVWTLAGWSRSDGGLAHSGLSFGLAATNPNLSGEEHSPHDSDQQDEVEHDLERDEDSRGMALGDDIAEPDGADHG